MICLINLKQVHQILLIQLLLKPLWILSTKSERKIFADMKNELLHYATAAVGANTRIKNYR